MPYTNDLDQSTRVRGSSNTHKNSNCSNTCTRVKKRAQEITQRSYSSTKQSSSMVAMSRGCRMFKECLGNSSICLEGSFYSPKGQRIRLEGPGCLLSSAHETMNSMQFLSFPREIDCCQPLAQWHTGQSRGAPDILV